MKRLTVFLLLTLPFHLLAQSTSFPVSFLNVIHTRKLDRKYSLNGYLKPAFLEADFNGDGIKDIAALVVEKRTKKKGILLITGSSNSYYLFGAGVKFGSGSDDFKWASGWHIFKGKKASETIINNEGDISGSKKVKLNRPAFYIYDNVDNRPNSGGIIYWNGKTYIWIQQGE
jgi:hypothetical protein